MKKPYYRIIMILILFTNVVLSSNIKPAKTIDSNKTNLLNEVTDKQTPLVKQTIQERNVIQIEAVPKINLVITQPINWYLILLPIGTMLIVIAGYFMTRRQLELTSKASINAYNKTINHQTELSKMEVLSKNRQAWINNLRDEVSRYIGFCQSAYFAHNGNATVKSKLPENLTRIVEIRAKINLLLNPTEENSKILTEQMNSLSDIIKEHKDVEKLREQISDITKVTQKILKEEWEKVKATK